MKQPRAPYDFMAVPARRALACKPLEHPLVPAARAYACLHGEYWGKTRDTIGNVLVRDLGTAVGEVARRKKTGWR